MTPQVLRDRVQSGQCVLFLGAGATRDAGGPTGPELAQLLANHFGKIDIPAHDLTQFTGMLTSLPDVERDDVDRVIVESLKRLEPSKGHRLLPLIPWRALFTTNYDRLIEIAYESALSATGSHPLQDLHVAISAEEQVSVSDGSRLCLFKLHGCISAINRPNPLVLTPKDFRDTQKKRNKMLRFLKSLAKEHALLFIGYSFSDGILTQLLEELKRESPYHSRRTMYVVAPSFSPTEQAYYESERFVLLSQTFSQFLEEIAGYIDEEAKKTALGRRIAPISSPEGNTVNLPTRLRVSLENQLEFVNPDAYPQDDARPFLRGLPPSVGDLKSRNDIERGQQGELVQLLRAQLARDDYLRPLVVILGAGGSGKSTVSLRCAFELAESREATVFRLKSEDLWRREEIVDLASRIGGPTILVCDNIEVHTRFKALRDLRVNLSAARCRSLLVASCQKAVWNELERTYPQQDAVEFFLTDRLAEYEVRSLIEKLASHGLLEVEGRKGLIREVRRVLDEYDGNLIVTMLELVGDGVFGDIVLSEYENLTRRAKDAYLFVALVHQHRRSIPDYLLNELTVRDWNVFTEEIIRLESELIIVQDIDFGAGRLCFRTRHPEIAKIVVNAVLSKHEDRVRMYRQIVGGLGASEEDRAFLLGFLTSRGVRNDLGHQKYVEEFLEKALELFPMDRAFILQLGKFENQVGNYDKAHELLRWGLSLEPSDSYIIHQLGVCEQRRAEASDNPTVQEARFQEAQRLYREKQVRDPQSHYGYSYEARMHLRRARFETDEQRKLDLLSAAMDAVRRGKDLVREDDRGVLQECEAEAALLLGDRAGLTAHLEQLARDGRIRYGSSYHLLAVAHYEDGGVERAFDALERGLEAFPGDARLLSFMLELLEGRFHVAKFREKSRELLRGRDIDQDNIRAHFLRAVSLFYDNHFHRSRDAFERIRRVLNRQASTRIRLYLCGADETPEERKGVVRLGSRGRVYIIDQESGERPPLDNKKLWTELGQPSTVFFRLGFSMAGARAVVVRPRQVS